MKPKLLIIDELSAYLFFIKKVMINNGFEVVVSDDKKEVYKYILQNSPDIILIDVRLNKNEGFNILKKIKFKLKISAPAIVISRCKNVHEIEKAFDYGAYDYLIKPLNLRDLKNKVRKALEKDKFNKSSYHV